MGISHGLFAHRRAAASLTAIAVALTAVPALAADEAAADAAATGAETDAETGKVDTIVVTATKRGEGTNVQDVNAAITAMGTQQLKDANFTDLQSLTYNVPNVQLDQVGTTPGYQNFSFRGLGINSSIVTIEPTVGVFVDGVYQGINAGQVFDTFDLDGIEILRGPQGVLFGRNVTAGAVLLRTGAPSFTTHIRGGVKVESGPNFTGDVVVTGPIAGDVLAGKLAVFYNNDAGWFRNKLDGSKFGGQEEFIVRPAFLLKPADGVEITLRGEHGEIDGKDSGVAAQNHALYSRDSFDFLVGEPGYNNADWTSVTGETNIKVGFGDGTITNIAGWREYNQKTMLDVDGTVNIAFDSTMLIKQDQFSNELRYAGTFGPVALTVGGFYFQQHIFHIEQRTLAGGGTVISGGGDYHHRQWAAFANGDTKLSDKLTLNTGVRWSTEYKRLHGSVYRPGGCSLVTETCVYTFPEDPTTYPSTGGPANNTWDSLSAKVGLQYQPSEQSQLYAYWARSFRSGGYNIRQTAVGTNPGPFDQERQDTFEAGYKVDFADRRARINMAAFHNYIHGIQREVNLPSSTGVAQNIVNAGNLVIYGFEGEAQFNPVPGLRLSAQVGYTHGKYVDVFYDLNNDGAINAADLALKPPRLSPWTYGASIRYEVPVGDGNVTAFASFNHRDSSFYDDRNIGWLNPMDDISANLAYSPNRSITFTIYGKNLLNSVAYGGDTQLPNIAAFGGDGAGPLPLPTFSPLAKGRVIGASLRFDF